jgi:hypothetical protein
MLLPDNNHLQLIIIKMGTIDDDRGSAPSPPINKKEAGGQRRRSLDERLDDTHVTHHPLHHHISKGK